ncbi:GyrI-like domain-containing protein [Nocardioides zeae]|uniref:GyrI-like domain-containing protein n=1 Tax=Nocardioides imazamoxiresistens TaxID=3231893 RepID=A0ABU3PT44_9ACTN|nr:GyrI-like domain-containing protein [Nocardioides zeae]MDT9592361.1 GyrI-like domain-containing protein [Nocardioides zeae]
MSAPERLDVRRDLDHYRARRGEFRDLVVPAQRYLMVDGAGDPNTAPAYAEALAALYPVAYAVKFVSRAAGHDHVVPPLEALWWAPDLAMFTTARDKSAWCWTAMILVPDHVPDALVETAVAAVAAKPRPTALDRLRLDRLDEGRCVQTLHVGPYDDEGPVLARLHDEVLPAAGLQPTGRHHEIYLGDPRRTAPERLRTVLRQPVAYLRPS